MRVRERNLDKPPTYWERYNAQGGDQCNQPADRPTVVADSGYLLQYARSEEMHDVVTPNFQELQSKGLVVNNPMTKITSIKEHILCDFYIDYGYRSWYTSCNPDQWLEYRSTSWGQRPSSEIMGEGASGLPAVPSYDSTSLIESAVNKAYANIDVTDVNALVMLGESEKTVASIAAIFRRLIKIVKKIKRLDKHGLLMELTPKQLADRYMELRYAIRPLLYDAKGTLAALKNQAGEAMERVTFRGSKVYEDLVETDTDQSEVTYSNNKGDWIRTWTKRTVSHHTVLVRAGVLTQLQELSSLSIWGFTQPVEAIWELVPFSFVVDWFLNVGDTLSAWTPNYGIKALASWYTVEESVYRSIERLDADAIIPAGDSTHVPTEWSYQLGECRYSELDITKIRVPNPRRSIVPNWNIRLDGFKLADLTIILRQIFASR